MQCIVSVYSFQGGSCCCLAGLVGCRSFLIKLNVCGKWRLGGPVSRHHCQLPGRQTYRQTHYATITYWIELENNCSKLYRTTKVEWLTVWLNECGWGKVFRYSFSSCTVRMFYKSTRKPDCSSAKIASKFCFFGKICVAWITTLIVRIFLVFLFFFLYFFLFSPLNWFCVTITFTIKIRVWLPNQ